MGDVNGELADTFRAPGSDISIGDFMQWSVKNIKDSHDMSSCVVIAT